MSQSGKQTQKLANILSSLHLSFFIIYILESCSHCQALHISHMSLKNYFHLLFAVTFYNLDKPVLEFTKRCHGHAVFCLPSCCCFHCLFSHSQTVFQLIPTTPQQWIQGQPGLHHTPNPTQSCSLQGHRWSSCSLMFLSMLSQPESRSILLTLKTRHFSSIIKEHIPLQDSVFIYHSSGENTHSKLWWDT